MTKEEAAEIILGGGKIICHNCGGDGCKPGFDGGPEQCWVCEGHGYFLSNDYITACVVLGIEKPNGVSFSDGIFELYDP